MKEATAVSKRVYPLVKAWRKKYPERVHAHRVVFVGMRNGTIKRKCCKVCGNPKTQAHHEDYSKPNSIIWLCKPHHVEADKRRRLRINKATS